MRLKLFLFIFFFISACSTRPYVHKAEQYDRSSDDFAKTVTDISHVTICYNVFAANPSEIRKLAREECARFGKFVNFLKQDYDICPVTAPMAAYYKCVGNNVLNEGDAARGVSKEALKNYDGIQFRY